MARIVMIYQLIELVAINQSPNYDNPSRCVRKTHTIRQADSPHRYRTIEKKIVSGILTIQFDIQYISAKTKLCKY